MCVHALHALCMLFNISSNCNNVIARIVLVFHVLISAREGCCAEKLVAVVQCCVMAHH